jgi:hypothetical protein
VFQGFSSNSSAGTATTFPSRHTYIGNPPRALLNRLSDGKLKRNARFSIAMPRSLEQYRSPRNDLQRSGIINIATNRFF